MYTSSESFNMNKRFVLIIFVICSCKSVPLKVNDFGSYFAASEGRDQNGQHLTLQGGPHVGNVEIDLGAQSPKILSVSCISGQENIAKMHDEAPHQILKDIEEKLSNHSFAMVQLMGVNNYNWLNMLQFGHQLIKNITEIQKDTSEIRWDFVHVFDKLTTDLKAMTEKLEKETSFSDCLIKVCTTNNL